MKKYKTIQEFVDDLEPTKRQQVDILRDLILGLEPKLHEEIKWNAPSYVLDGENRITFNILNKEGAVKLILHMGTGKKENKNGAPAMNDDSGLIEWASDIRGILTFKNVEETKSKLSVTNNLLAAWLALPTESK